MRSRSVRRWRAGAVAAIASVLLLSACSSSTDSSTAASTTSAPAGTSTTSAAAPKGTTAGSTPQAATAEAPLRILVTNDDGVGAPGIDAVVEGLRTLPNVEIIVVAPADEQSSTGAQTTEGPLTVTEVTTASGHPATAVAGFPADTIVWAIDDGGVTEAPDLVISGINSVQNLGPLIELSGTVGAARAAGSRGIPALAVSQGIADEPDYPSAVALVLDWVRAHRDEILDGNPTTPARVDNLNVPTCQTGSLHDLVEVPVAADAGGRVFTDSDCIGEPPEPADDIDAFIFGFPSLSDITPS